MQGSSSFYIILMVVVFGMMFWTLYQNSQAQKKRRALQNDVKRGDRVVTVGGIVGKVSQVRDNHIMLQVSEGVEIEVLKAGIGSRLEN